MDNTIPSLLDECARLWNIHKPAEALTKAQKILEIDPKNSLAMMNVGACYGVMEGLTPRVRCLFQKAYELDRNNINAILNLATISLDDCEYDKCLKLHDEMLELQPLNSLVLDSKGRLLVTMGKVREGFALMEHGLGLEDGRGKLQPFRQAAWRGDYCNKLLITNEQGFGDTIQMIRYAEHCKGRANKVYLLAAPCLKRMLETCPWIDGVVSIISDNEFDQHISVMSLPHLFDTTMETVPHNIPYIFARKSDIERFPVKSDKKKVGICWAGNPRKNMMRASLIDKKRSMTFDLFRQFMDKTQEIQFYNIQLAAHENRNEPNYLGFEQAVESGLVIDPMREVRDFADTAAIIMQLDLVITVDTSVAHVAGALGKPVWVLSRFSGCWRWFTNRSDSPWYPFTRLFRQPLADDWESVTAQVKLALDIWKQE